VASVAHPNGVTTAVESNALGLVTRIRTTDRSGATVQALEYRHDAGDRIAWQSDGRVTRSYAYDGAGRLTGLRDSRGGVEAWTLDAMGNRLAGADGRRFAADPCNRISGAGEDAIRHDGLGRVVAARLQRGMARLHWNGRGQLLRVEMADGRVADYAYDAFGRRIRKGVDGRVTRYLWAGQMLLSEVTEGGGVVRRRDHLVLPDLFVPLAVWVDGRPLRLHTDHRCVPLAATDAAGHVA
jgi:YD repeat-containing protein